MVFFGHIEFYKINLTKISFWHRDLQLLLSKKVDMQHLTFMKLLFSPSGFSVAFVNIMNIIVLKNPSLYLVLLLKKSYDLFIYGRCMYGSAPQKAELHSHEIRITDRVYEADFLMESLHSWYFQKQDSNRMIYVPGLAKKEAICMTSFTWLFAKGLNWTQMS